MDSSGTDALIGVHARLLSLGPAELDRLRNDSAASERIALVRNQLAELLHSCASSDQRMPDVLRHAFGVLSGHHEHALRSAVRRGGFDAAVLAFDGPAITAAVGAPWRFETYLGVGPYLVDDAAPHTDEPYRVCTPHGQFKIGVSNGVELWRAATVRTKEPDTIAWLDDTLDEGDTFWDVGANIGCYTLWAAHLVRGVTVVAIEPDPVNAARLMHNITINNFENTVVVTAALGGDEKSHSVFHPGPGLAVAGLASLRADGEPAPMSLLCAHGAPASMSLLCPTTTIDCLVGDPPALPTPTHIKIDVDGAELAVLSGAPAALRAVRHAMVEVCSSEVDAVNERMHRAGLEVVSQRWQPAETTRGRIGNLRYARAAIAPHDGANRGT